MPSVVDKVMNLDYLSDHGCNLMLPTMATRKPRSLKKQLCEGANFLTKYQPDDVDINLGGEIKHFHGYIKQNYSDKILSCYQNLVLGHTLRYESVGFP